MIRYRRHTWLPTIFLHGIRRQANQPTHQPIYSTNQSTICGIALISPQWHDSPTLFLHSDRTPHPISAVTWLPTLFLQWHDSPPYFSSDMTPHLFLHSDMTPHPISAQWHDSPPYFSTVTWLPTLFLQWHDSPPYFCTVTWLPTLFLHSDMTTHHISAQWHDSPPYFSTLTWLPTIFLHVLLGCVAKQLGSKRTALQSSLFRHHLYMLVHGAGPVIVLHTHTHIYNYI